MASVVSMRSLNGVVKEIRVTPGVTRVSQIPNLIGLKISKFEKFSIVAGDQKFPSESVIPTGYPEVQIMKETDICGLSTALTMPLKRAHLHLDADALEALDELKRMDNIPSSMAIQFIESLGQSLFHTWGHIESFTEFLHEMSRLIGQRCEDLDSVADVLLPYVVAQGNIHRHMYFWVMILEIALRDPSILKGSTAAKVIGMDCFPPRFFMVLSETLRSQYFQVSPGLFQVYSHADQVFPGELVLSLLPQVIRILGDKGVGEHLLLRLNSLMDSLDIRGFAKSGKKGSLKACIEALSAFLREEEDEKEEEALTRAEEEKKEEEEEKPSDGPDYQMLESALLGSDAASCHLLACKVATGERLSSLQANAKFEEAGQVGISESAPGRLENASSSARSSWRRAAQTLQDVEGTSQVTPEQWPSPRECSHDINPSLHSSAALVTDAATEDPVKPPGVFYAVVDNTDSCAATAAAAAAAAVMFKSIINTAEPLMIVPAAGASSTSPGIIHGYPGNAVEVQNLQKTFMKHTYPEGMLSASSNALHAHGVKGTFASSSALGMPVDGKGQLRFDSGAASAVHASELKQLITEDARTAFDLLSNHLCTGSRTLGHAIGVAKMTLPKTLASRLRALDRAHQKIAETAKYRPSYNDFGVVEDLISFISSMPVVATDVGNKSIVTAGVPQPKAQVAD